MNCHIHMWGFDCFHDCGAQMVMGKGTEVIPHLKINSITNTSALRFETHFFTNALSNMYTFGTRLTVMYQIRHIFNYQVAAGSVRIYVEQMKM